MCKLGGSDRLSNTMTSPPASPSIGPDVLHGLKIKNTFLNFDIQKIYLESLDGEDTSDDEVTCIRRRCITEPARPENGDSESCNMYALAESSCSTASTAASSPRSDNDPTEIHVDALHRSSASDRSIDIVEPSDEVEQMRMPSAHLQYVMPVFMPGMCVVPMSHVSQPAVANTPADQMDEMANFWLKRAENAKLAIESLRAQVECKISDSVVELPSAGSEGHAQGLCKPCAWFHSSKGCNNGSSCEFCHACGPREIKRRRRERARLLAAQNS